MVFYSRSRVQLVACLGLWLVVGLCSAFLLPPTTAPARSIVARSATTEAAAPVKKNELLDHVAEKSGVTKVMANKVLAGFMEVIADSLTEGKRVSLTGFGSFSISERKARVGRNPRTGETLQIAASKSVTFSPSKALKDQINHRS